jgi:phospholipid/cholesterol/gamma-HCH transport system ATP-binding protein
MNNDKHTAIAVQELRKSFGAQKVLNGITFQVGQGETVAVIGRSGGGKSVLLKLLIGLQMPDSGSIRVGDEEIVKLDNKRLNDIRKTIGFLFQQAALYDSLSVAENVDFPLSRHSEMSAQERGQRVRNLLAEVGMDQELEKFPSQLSGGMQKRVGLARA